MSKCFAFYTCNIPDEAKNIVIIEECSSDVSEWIEVCASEKVACTNYNNFLIWLTCKRLSEEGLKSIDYPSFVERLRAYVDTMRSYIRLSIQELGLEEELHGVSRIFAINSLAKYPLVFTLCSRYGIYVKPIPTFRIKNLDKYIEVSKTLFELIIKNYRLFIRNIKVVKEDSIELKIQKSLLKRLLNSVNGNAKIEMAKKLLEKPNSYVLPFILYTAKLNGCEIKDIAEEYNYIVVECPTSLVARYSEAKG